MMTLAPVSAVDSAADTRRVLEPGERIAQDVAWGIVDAILYLMGSLAQKGRSLKTYRLAPPSSWTLKNV